ncbi:MAG: GNAT family N-acetyltransferase [Sphingobium sp.]|uniref:GNAT family N-acetyltransferase n=1 Tax=Sphingobium sp. TaxID=1912891 RepID=UPI0029B7EFAC|nr:GNAT family N-acetyltransferase [Sphingobium sp.]MDX3909209.1 GNAT family N-acetyltransferase [Sphingobium sp.]
MAAELPADYTLSDDPARLQPEAIHAYLSASYWSPGIARSLVERAIAGSHCVGIYHGEDQVAFARVITDHATFAHLADVYVLEAHQGRGLAAAMLRYFHTHPDLQGLRRWTLNTRDAHGLYERHGWQRITGIFMQRYDGPAVTA